MKTLPVLLIVFWFIIILAPEILAYLIGGFFIFVWLNMLIFIKKVKWSKEDYVKFWKYKIFR